MRRHFKHNIYNISVLRRQYYLLAANNIFLFNLFTLWQIHFFTFKFIVFYDKSLRLLKKLCTNPPRNNVCFAHVTIQVPIVPDNDDVIYLIGQKTKYSIYLLRCRFDKNIKNAYARWFATAHNALWSAFVCIIKCCTGGQDVIIINEKKQNKKTQSSRLRRRCTTVISPDRTNSVHCNDFSVFRLVFTFSILEHR